MTNAAARRAWWTRNGRDLAVDAALFLVAASAGVGLALAPTAPGDAPWYLADNVAGVVACASLWARRRWPFAIGIGTTLLTAFSQTAGVASGIALLTVAIHRPMKQSLTVAVLGVLISAVFPLLRPNPDLSFWFVLALGGTLTLGVLGWGLAIRQRRQLVAELRERAVRAESEAALRAEQAQLRAREQVAREMHDVLGHRLSLLSVQAGALEYRRDASAAEIAGAAGLIRASAHQALQDLREVLQVLRAETSELPQPTLSDLDELVAESHRAGMRIALRTTLRTGELPSQVGLAAYRIVQEGLTNARKHAPDAEVSVTLDGRANQGLHIELRNGLPVHADPRTDSPGGQGLIGLGERVLLAGGYLAAGPDHAGSSGSGQWRLWAWLPWPA